MGKKSGLKIEVNGAPKRVGDPAYAEADGARDARGKEEEAADSLAKAVAQREDFNAHHRQPQKRSHTVAECLQRCID